MNPVKAAAARATHRQIQKGEIRTNFTGFSSYSMSPLILVNLIAHQVHQAPVNPTMSQPTPATTHQNHRQSPTTTMTRRRTQREREIHRPKRAMRILVLAQ